MSYKCKYIYLFKKDIIIIKLHQKLLLNQIKQLPTLQNQLYIQQPKSFQLTFTK